MSKNLNPKCKQCRRAGEKLFLKGDRCITAKCAIIKRNYAPGIHGAKGARRRFSEYGTQLMEKQKAKKQYNLLEKQFRLTFEKAKKQQGDSGENLIKLLEKRFDNVIFRLGLASSRREARVLVNHGHFTVNGKKVNIPSCQVKAGDVIKIKESSKRKKAFDNIEGKTKKAEIPAWLNFDLKESMAKVLHDPSSAQIKSNINLPMIVEFYSR